MKTFWDKKKGQQVENKQVENFLKEIDEVSKRHNLSISHEDKEGSFLVAKRNSFLVGWLNNASIDNVGPDKKDKLNE